MTIFVHYLRDELKRHYNTGQFWLNIDVDDVASFDQSLAEKLLKQPSEHLTLVCDVTFSKILTTYRVCENIENLKCSIVDTA